MEPDGPDWNQMEPTGTRWNRMEPPVPGTGVHFSRKWLPPRMRPGFDSPASRSASLFSAVSNWPTRQMPERFLVYRPQPTPVQFLKNKIPTQPHPPKLVLTN